MSDKPTYEELEQRVKELEREAIDRKKAGKGIEHQSGFLNIVLEFLPYPFYVIDAFDHT